MDMEGARGERREEMRLRLECESDLKADGRLAVGRGGGLGGQVGKFENK